MGDGLKAAVAAIVFLMAIVGAIAFCMWAFPTYGVWRAGLSGQAKLKQAEQEKQIMIETAKAEMESAKLRAEAIAIVGKASQDFPEYRQQEFIAAFGEAIQSGEIEQIIYVPTEANIPIVEAGRVAQ